MNKKNLIILTVALIILIIIALTIYIVIRNKDTSLTYSTETYIYSSDDDEIMIKYPAIASDNTITSLIRNKALSIYQESDETQIINVIYQITYNKDGYLSVVFTGTTYTASAEYSINIRYTINIDVNNQQVITLGSVYTIDDDLYDLYINKLKSNIGSNALEYVNSLSEDELKEQFKNIDDDESIFSSNINEDTISINLTVSHDVGDNITIELTQEELLSKLISE